MSGRNRFQTPAGSKQKNGADPSSTTETADEVFDKESGDFFGDFEGGSGPSKRKAARATFERETRTGKTLEAEAMDPAVSAAEARKKIANLVRARAGLGALSDGSESAAKLSKAERVEAKFARKDARKEQAISDAQKYKKVNKVQSAIGRSKGKPRHRR